YPFRPSLSGHPNPPVSVHDSSLINLFYNWQPGLPHLLPMPIDARHNDNSDENILPYVSTGPSDKPPSNIRPMAARILWQLHSLPRDDQSPVNHNHAPAFLWGSRQIPVRFFSSSL